MDAATVDVLVARTLSSLGHGRCDSGCAGSTDVIIGCCDSGCAGSTDVIILGPWMLRQWMCWQHGRYHPGAMEPATVDVLVARTLSPWGHGCCDSGCAGSTDVIILGPWAMDAAKLDVLVARKLSSWGHGCCDSGCAGSTDDIILGPWMLRHWMCTHKCGLCSCLGFGAEPTEIGGEGRET